MSFETLDDRELIKLFKEDPKKILRFFTEFSQLCIFISCLNNGGEVYLSNHIKESNERTNKICVKYLIEKGDEIKLKLFNTNLVNPLKAIIKKDIQHFKLNRVLYLNDLLLDAIEYNFDQYLECIKYEERYTIILHAHIKDLILSQKNDYVFKIIKLIKNPSDLLYLSALVENENMINWLIDNVEDLNKYKTYQGLIEAGNNENKNLFKYLLNSSRFTNDDIMKIFGSIQLKSIFDIIVDSRRLDYETIKIFADHLGRRYETKIRNYIQK